jgi:hypothetical protein
MGAKEWQTVQRLDKCSTLCQDEEGQLLPSAMTTSRSSPPSTSSSTSPPPPPPPTSLQKGFDFNEEPKDEGKIHGAFFDIARHASIGIIAEIIKSVFIEAIHLLVRHQIR